MHEFRIERGIPIPPASRPGGTGWQRWRKAFEEMLPGDSILVPREANPAGYHRAEAAARMAARRVGIKITIRRMDDGIRIWRVD